MKKFLWAGLMVVTLGGMSWAKLAQGDRLLNLDVGLVGPVTHIDLGGFFDERIADGGATGGAQFLYQVTPLLGLGADLKYSAPSEHQSLFNFLTRDRVSGTSLRDTLSNLKTTTLLAISRLTFVPEGTAHFYVFGGLGFHRSSFKLEGRPTSLGWADTGTFETRTFNDSRGTAFAGALGGGIDIFVTPTTLLGAELRWEYLGKTNFASDSGLYDVNTSISLLDLLFRIGFKF